MLRLKEEDYRLKKMAKLVSGRQSVLDLGCADLSNRFYKNSNIVGFDLINKFDAVVAGELLEHFEEPIKFLRKWYKVLM